MGSKKDVFAYCFGWSDGAGAKPIYNIRGDDPISGSHYHNGYLHGQRARRKAAKAFADKMGVKLDEVTTNAKK